MSNDSSASQRQIADGAVPPVILRMGSSIRGGNVICLGGGAPMLGLLVGLNPGATTLDDELAKVELAARRGVATVTDLTTSSNSRLLKHLLDQDMAVGTVPTYALLAAVRNQSAASFPTTLFSAIENQVAMGVDFLSIHPSLTEDLVAQLPASGRTIPITSRGGSLILQIMAKEKVNNPFRNIFDDLVAMCAEHNVVLSFVGSFRPGSVVDVHERLHLAELAEIAELARQAHDAGVQTIVELVNHIPLSDICARVSLGRSLFPYSALGALGPTPTDIAVGLDDIAGAIGAAVAALAGIDWINIVTAGEHSHLPRPTETARALDYFKLALHIAAVARGQHDRDRTLSMSRAHNDWAAMSGLAISAELAADVYAEHQNRQGGACSMCRATCPLVRFEKLRQQGGIDGLASHT